MLKSPLSGIDPTPPCFVPLYRLRPSDPVRPFKFHGTGTLLWYRNRPLLVTAAHVVEDAPEGLAVMLPRDGEMSSRKVSSGDASIETWEHVLVRAGGDVRILPDGFEKTPVAEGKTRADDLIDIAAMALAGDFAQRITFGPIGYSTLPAIPNCEVSAGTKLLFAGYPENVGAKEFPMSEGTSFNLQGRAICSPLLAPQNFPVGVPRSECFVAPFMDRQTYDDHPDREADFTPHGMSGGPIFLHTGEALVVVGISTSWGDKDGFVVGTKLSAAAGILDRAIARTIQAPVE